MLEAAGAPRFPYPLGWSLQEEVEAAARDQPYASARAEGWSLSKEDAVAEALEVG